MHIKKALESLIIKTSTDFRVVLLTGPRQVGKTTLLESLEQSSRSYITMDEINFRIAAEQDPKSFIVEQDFMNPI